MKYIQATQEHAKIIYDIVQETITKIYPEYYPKEVVDFFCCLHSKENIERDIVNGCVGVLIDNEQIVGTGSYKDNHITRVYVAPKYQKRGYGSYIMQSLESYIAIQHEKAYLDSSLPARHLYRQRGYRTVKNLTHVVDYGVILEYEVMEKIVHSDKKKNKTITENYND